MPKYFSKETFAFLNQLARNNERDWFNEHKGRYEKYVRQPALDFIADCQKPLSKVSPMFRAEAKKVGGSLMRVFRDTRFSKDKSPYKSNLGIHFRHELGRDVHCPGFYVHLEPRNSFLGVGIWHPDNPSLQKIRGQISEAPKEWKSARDFQPFQSQFKLSG